MDWISDCRLSRTCTSNDDSSPATPTSSIPAPKAEDEDACGTPFATSTIYVLSETSVVPEITLNS